MSIPQLGKPTSLKFARSPQFLTGRNDFVSGDDLYSMDINLSVYSGLRSASVPVDISFQKLYAVNRRINFEVSDIVRSKFSHDFNIWQGSVPTASPTGEVLWSKVTGGWTYSDAGATPVMAPIGTNYWYSTDGWHDKFTPQNSPCIDILLAVNRLRRCPSTSYDMLPVQYDGSNGNLQSVVYTINNVTHVYDIALETGLSNTSLDSTDKVLYLPCGYQNVAALASAKGWSLPAQDSTITIGFYDVVLPPEEDPPVPLFDCVKN